MFLVLFEGPWVFATDQSNQMVTAIAVPCPGHTYTMGEPSAPTAIGQGTYSLTDVEAVTPIWSKLPPAVETQVAFSGLPRGAAVPELADASAVRCSFKLPLTGLWPMQYALRSRQPADFGDNLLSGRNFRQLRTPSTPGAASCVGLGMALPYSLNAGHTLQLKNTEGAIWTAPPDSQGNVVLQITGTDPSTTPNNDDHFAMTAAAFGLDLHMDGPDVLPSTPTQDAPYPRPSGLNVPFTTFIPLLCGGNIVIEG
ncbi:MAG TPA: hypothetical protein VN690_11555 [Terriglobales bacterium]|nr:hypothetical protein [Terriglobales bacterium]